MPLPYTGRKGESNFEEDFIDLLISAGWESNILKNKTVDELKENWYQIVYERNIAALNSVPLSDGEKAQLDDALKQQADTPVKANLFLNTAERGISIIRDRDSKDTVHAGKEAYLNLFNVREIAGGSSRYQIAEQTHFIQNGTEYSDRRGDVTLLIDGLPIIHIELKASGIDVHEACTQIRKYALERVFTGFMSTVQMFWAITPEDALYFANPGDESKFNPSYYFHWGDRDNNVIKDWRELITGKSHILSVPEAHKMIGYYTVADKDKNILKICRNYQYAGIKAIVKRTAQQKWGDHDQLGGYVWCTTGGGKTMTSFKAGQLIIDMNLADKVVFVVDRKALDEQSLKEYRSFSRSGETVSGAKSTKDLFRMLHGTNSDESMIMTSIQKLSNIHEDAKKFDPRKLQDIESKRIVFIIDEAHRSQFGVMHQSVKNTFYNALFFGFTGTPIMKLNMREGEQTTEKVFGQCLAVYSLATGIRDGNVLGFWPEYISVFKEEDEREAVALHEAKVPDASQLTPGTDAYKTYQYYKEKAPLAAKHDSDGKVTEKGIEDFLSDADFNTPAHREAVVDHILKNWDKTAYGPWHLTDHGTDRTMFHGLLATTSIEEACEYWDLFQKKAPEKHVTALFDPNVDNNLPGVVDKQKWLIRIVDQYNKDFGTAYNRKNDPDYTGFKSDLIARLSHKKPYVDIGNDHNKCLDLVIVVDQLLTGFDSDRLNVVYMDKVMEMDGLIQAISRTNRVFNSDDKPFGLVKFFRKPETMKYNLDAALELYCEGDTIGVKEKELKENLSFMNTLYDEICVVFSHDKIKNFSKIPSLPEDQQKFRKDYIHLKAAMRAAILQGFDWNGIYASELHFDEMTYKTLGVRFSELPSTGTGGGARSAAVGLGINVNLTADLGSQIDADYLEARFKILTISEVEQATSKAEVLKDIYDHLSVLPVILQKYARQVLTDIQTGVLKVTPGVKFMEYINEYHEKAVRKAIDAEAARFGIDADLFFDLYNSTGSAGLDQVKLQHVEETADMTLTAKTFGVSGFKAKKKLHAELSDFITNKKAEA